MSRSHNPRSASTSGLGWPDFARRYFRDRGCFLFLRVLRCFSSPGSLPSLALRMTDLAAGRVAPFGDPGITACLQLPQAYRSLPRPSSPPCAKASTVRPYALDLSVSVCVLTITTHTRVSCERTKKRGGSRVESAGDDPGVSRPPPLRTVLTRDPRMEQIQSQLALRP